MLKRFIQPVVALALLAPIALCQNGAKPAAPAAKPAAPAAKPAAAAPTAMPATSSMLHLPVTGLTADNADKVKSALQAATNTDYVCSHCKNVDAEAGQHCGKDREAVNGTAMAEVSVDAKAGTVSFAVPAGRMLKLSDVEKVLKAQGVAVAGDKFQIGSDATLLVSGVADAAGGETLKKALADAKLGDQVDVDLSGGRKEAKVTIRKAGMTPATQTRLKDAIGKANSAFAVSDVIWSAPAKT
jgi:hypothetical protein